MINQKGVTPILLLLAAAGIITFILSASTLPFKDQLFSLLYPKPASKAQVVSGVNFKTYKGLNFPWGINSKGTSTFRDWLSSKYDEQVTTKAFEEIKGMGVRTVGMWLWFDRMLVKDASWGTDAYVTKFDPTFKANWESFLKNVVKAKDMEVVVTMFPGAGGEERDPYMIDRDTFIPVPTGNDILGTGVANGDMAIDENPKDGLPDGWTVNTGSAQNSFIYESGDGTTGSPARDLKLTSNSTSQISVISPKVPYPSQGTLLALSATYKGNLVSFKTLYYDSANQYLGDDFFSPNLSASNNTANWTTVTWPSRTVKIPAGTAKIAINANAGANGTTSIGPVRIAPGVRNAKWRNYMQAVKDWVSMYGSNTEYGPAVASWHGIKEVSDGWNFFVTRDFSRDFYQTIKSTGTTQPVGIDNSPYFRLAVTKPENQPWFNDAADYYSLHMYNDDGTIPDTSNLDKPFILGEFGATWICPNGGSPERGDCKGSDTHLGDPTSNWNRDAVSKFYPNGQTAGAKTALGWAWVSNSTIAQHNMDGTNVLGNAGQWIKDWNPDGIPATTPTPTPNPTPTAGSQEPYGVNDWNWIDDSMTSAKEAGVTWMRVGINWPSVEAVKGTYVWSQGANNNIDFYFSQAQKYGMKVSVVPYNAPDWAKIKTNDVWRDSGAYANFVKELLLRYPGKIGAVEVLNEDSTISWPDTKWRDAYYYLPLLKTAYQTVKAVDPGIIVTTAALWSSPVGYLEDLYQMGAKDYFDVVNFHYYPGKNSPANNFNWLISHYRQIMKKYGDGNKSIWLTEFGWNVDNAAQEANNIVSPQQQSDYMTYVLSSSMKSGFVGKVFWYDWHGDDGMTAIHTTNNYYWNILQPQLVSSIGSGDTALTVSNTTQNMRGETRTVDWTKGWPSSGTLIIDTEKINYTSLAVSAGTTIVSGLTRGTAGSAAASHTAGVRVLNQDLTANFKRQAYYTYKKFIQANPQWDASKVTPLPDVPPPASSAIAITNNGFENSATDWSGGLTIDPSQGHSGNSSAKIANTLSPTTRWVRASHRTIPVEPGKSYFLKAWVKIDPSGSGNMNAMVTGDLRNSAGSFLAGTPSNYYIYRTDGNWREIHYPFSTPADATQLVIYVSTDGGTGTAWFDDISIEPYNLTNISPLPTPTAVPTPTPTPAPIPNPTSATFSLQTGTGYTQGAEIPVKVMAETSTDAANTFVGKINFPAQLLSVSRIDTTGSFVTNWTENYYDNTAGTISLVGAVPNPGYKTSGSPSLMATVYFTSKTSGTANLTFDHASMIYRNSDNVNILAKTTGTSITINPIPTPTPTPIPTPTPTPTPIPAPSSLTATAVSYNKINLSWNSANNTSVTAYWIIRDNVTIAQTTAKSYSDTSVSPSTNYSYQVVASDASGNNSDLSNIATVTTPAAPDTTPPTAPANLAATAISSYQIDLSWKGSTDNIGVVGYDIYQNGTLLTSVSGPTTTFGSSGLTPGASYSYYVVGKDAAGNASPASNTATITTPPLASPTPIPIFIKGDFNRDDAINFVDLSILLSNWGRTSFTPIGVDLNSDGVLNVFDFSLLKQILIDNNIIRVNP